MHQVPEEVILLNPAEIGILLAVVMHVRHDQHVELLACLDEGVRHSKRPRRVGVVVHLAVRQQNPALELRGQPAWKRLAVIRLIGQTMIDLGPRRDVDAILVVAGESRRPCRSPDIA
jgi:hypothetical protein